MKPIIRTSFAFALLVSGCVGRPPVAAPVPTGASGTKPVNPAPVTPPIAPEAAAPAPRATTWTFRYAPGTYTYTFVTNATVTPVTDSVVDSLQTRTVPEERQRAVITIPDSGGVQVVDPAPVTSATCDASAALSTRAQELIPTLPQQLTIGQTWRDSTANMGCRGMIPGEATVISHYQVAGDTVIDNMTALRIVRADSITAQGEGADGQHRIIMTAIGTGAGELYFDVATGRLIKLQTTQNSLVNITTSGRLAQFLQNVTATISIAGMNSGY